MATDGSGGEGTPPTFDATADVETNAELRIGDSEYADGDPWEAPFIYCTDADLTAVKAYLKNKDDTEHTVVPEGSACQWKVEGEKAGKSESLSAADFPDDFKDDTGNLKPGTYNVKAIYPDKVFWRSFGVRSFGVRYFILLYN